MNSKKIHSIEDMLVEKNYSRCPLKKRPVHYQFDSEDGAKAAIVEKHAAIAAVDQPENLSLKKSPSTDEDPIVVSSSSISVSGSDELSEDINVSDCCEDEGVDVDHRTDDEDDDNDIDCEDEEMIDCVDIEDDHPASIATTTAATSPATKTPAPAPTTTTTQAAALAAAAAAAAAATAAAGLVVPTPTYPKYGIQPWNFHMSPYTAEFYRTINNPHLAAAATQISPLRSDLLSPSSPSDSIGSLSPPPPHYMHGRASSVSPPMRSEIIHRPIGVRQLPPSSPSSVSASSPHHPHRFLPYPALPAYPHHPHHHHQHQHQTAYPLGFHPALPPHHHQHHGLHAQQSQQHHAPISPAYSDSSYYSMRSLTPDSNCSSLPEDLSVKSHHQHQHHHHLHQAARVESKTSAGSVCSSDENLPHTHLDAASSNAISSAASSTSSSSSGAGAVGKSKDKSFPPRYKCPDCQKSYSTFSGLTKHQQFHCPAAEGNQVKKSFSCKDCDKTYVSLGALKMHIRTHTLPCKCNICGKAFSRPWLLQGHIRTHTGEKPFSCQHCHRAFADRSNLRAHLQTHSDIKKYSCTSCSKTFSRMSLLTKHSEGGCPGGAASQGSPTSPDMAGYSTVYAEH